MSDQESTIKISNDELKELVNAKPYKNVNYDISDEDADLYFDFLKKFGKTSFLDKQMLVIHAFRQNENIFVINKTGGGKTLPISIFF